MNANSDALTKDPGNEGAEDPHDADKGFELDKLEIPKTSGKSAPASVSEGQSLAKPEPEGKTNPGSEAGGKSLPKALFLGGIVAAALLALAGGALLGFFMTAPSSSDDNTGPSDTAAYHEIDPIVTNLGLNSYVDVAAAVRLDSETPAMPPVSPSIVKNAILTFLWSPRLKKRISDSRAENHEALVEGELIELLQTQFQNRVIIKGVRVY